MKLSSEHSPQFDALNARAKALVCELLSHLNPKLKRQVIAAQEIVEAQPGAFYVISEGNIHVTRNGRTLFLLEEGDTFGLSQERTLNDLALRTDYAVAVDQYDIEDLYSALRTHASLLRSFCELQETRVHLHLLIATEVLRGESLETPEIRAFAPGSTMVEQGQQGAEVFTLLEGGGDVLVDGVKVGEIQTDEIFGALAALSGTPRIATVVARSKCLVLALHRDKFIDLMITRPTTVLKMVQDMARSMSSLNTQVVEFLKGRA